MESITVELCVAQDDPLDRTLSLLVRNEEGLVLHRAWRVADGIRSHRLATCVRDIVHRWMVPQLTDRPFDSDWIDSLEREIATPF